MSDDRIRFESAWSIAADGNLSPTTRLVAVVLLLKFCNSDSGLCFPSYTTLARACGITRRGTIYAVKRLRELGLLVVEQRGVTSNAYSFPLVNGGAPVVHGDALPSARTFTTLVHGDALPLVNGGAPKQEVLTPKGTTKGTLKGSCLSEDWLPTGIDIEKALQRGLREDSISLEVAKFKNYHIAKGSRMRSWPRAWDNWCINAVQFAAARRVKNGHHRPSAGQAIAAAEEWRQ